MTTLQGNIVLFVVYFLPTIVNEFQGNKRKRWPVFLVNLLFGWTGIGWVVALVMGAWRERA